MGDFFGFGLSKREDSTTSDDTLGREEQTEDRMSDFLGQALGKGS